MGFQLFFFYFKSLTGAIYSSADAFYSHTLQAARMKFKHMMIDKSKAEIKALQDFGIMHLLCKFHMLQDVERFCKSAESGIGGDPRAKKQKRYQVYDMWRSLQRTETEVAFKAECKDFKEAGCKVKISPRCFNILRKIGRASPSTGQHMDDLVSRSTVLILITC